MVTLEQVEKLCERANISYDEARTVLEATNGDMLEAIIMLEKQGRIKAPNGGGYYNSQEEKQKTSENTQEKNNEYSNNNKQHAGESFSKLLGQFFKWCCKIIHKGNINTLQVSKDGSKVVVIPVTVLVLLLIFTFWITVPLIIVGIFFGYRFMFHGPDIEKTTVNNVMDSVSDAADNLKKDVKDKHGNCNCDSNNCNSDYSSSNNNGNSNNNANSNNNEN